MSIEPLLRNNDGDVTKDHESIEPYFHYKMESHENQASHVFDLLSQ